MKINDLSRQVGVDNKTLISFLKERGYKVSSHMQNATDEMIDEATEHFEKVEEVVETIVKEIVEENPIVKEKVSTKTFSPDDLIPCRSVTPWKLMTVGVDQNTVYNWEYFGDVDYVRYKDLQAMRRKDIVTKPKILIEDVDLCSQWKRELGEIYKPFLGVDYPEELFDLSDAEFEKLLKTSNDTVREVVKVTALNMVRNQNYPALSKILLIDTILGTCIKEFL